MDSECLDEIQSLRPGCILSTRHLEKILETLLKLEERLEETCVIEFELFNLLASLAIDLKHENRKKCHALKSSGRKLYFYKGINLLDFDGDYGKYRAFGAFLVKRILPTEEERNEFCFSPRKKHRSVRKRAPREAEVAFKEAVRIFCGGSLYAYNRAKIGANQVGLKERFARNNPSK